MATRSWWELRGFRNRRREPSTCRGGLTDIVQEGRAERDMARGLWGLRKATEPRGTAGQADIQLLYSFLTQGKPSRISKEGEILLKPRYQETISRYLTQSSC